jgi:hypothetical protein
MTRRALEIHPSIGVARVGDSRTAWFRGPGCDIPMPLRYRGPDGRLMRQAAEFRVFECTRDASGRLLAATEVTLGDSKIEWTVHLVNRKGVARRFDSATFRNDASGDDDEDCDLIIDAGEQRISTPDESVALDSGMFMGTRVPLGEIQMDARGRLAVLGGTGTAGHIPHPSACPSVRHFTDNDYWYDDTSDGPVQASVTMRDGAVIRARSAWVVVMPPNYAPGIQSLVTWFDIATQIAVVRRWRTAHSIVEFWRDVHPILKRLNDYKWVNRLFWTDYGPGGRWDFNAVLADLADPCSRCEMRSAFVAALRDPCNPCQWPKPSEPRLRSGNDEHSVLALTCLQYSMLDSWARGAFVTRRTASSDRELPPDRLDRVNLESCIGAPLRPGIEVRDLISDPQIYDAAYHLDLSSLTPGRLTEGNAVPWQADFFSCRFDGRVAWWPSLRPDHVFTAVDDPTASPAVDWARGIATPDGMVRHWSDLGLVLQSTGSAGDRVYVETGRKLGAEIVV